MKGDEVGKSHSEQKLNSWETRNSDGAKLRKPFVMKPFVQLLFNEYVVYLIERNFVLWTFLANSDNNEYDMSEYGGGVGFERKMFLFQLDLTVWFYGVY